MALDWETPRDDLNAIGGLAGADASNRDSTVRRLEHTGGMYDAARADLGAGAVDAAKAAGDAAFAAASASWAAATDPVHESADQFAIFVDGGAPIAFAPDGSAGPALFERLTAAEEALADSSHPKHALAEELHVHTRAASQAYGLRPLAPTYGPPYTTRNRLLGGIPGTTRSYNLFEFERDILGPLIDEANLLIDELT